MFSYLLGKISGKDIRRSGDGNPGGFNLWHTCGWKIGILGSALDYIKGFIPLYFFVNGFAFSRGELLAISIAPFLGTAFSPFMRFKGGKGIAVTFGLWTALTLLRVPIVFAIFLILYPKFFFKLYKSTPNQNAFRVFVSFLGTGIYIYLAMTSYFYIWFVNTLLLIYTHRREFNKGLRFFGVKLRTP